MSSTWINGTGDPRQAIWENRNTALGAWFIGCFLDMFFLGVLVNQIFTYCRECKDSRRMRSFIAFLFALNIAKTIQALASLWNRLIIGWHDPSVFTHIPWYSLSNTLTSQIICIVAQSFFAVRLYQFIGRKYLVYLLVLNMLVSVGGGSALTYVLAHAGSDRFKRISITVGIGAMAISDLVVSIATSWMLLKSKEDAQSDRVDTLVSKILRLTWAAAIPPSIFAVLALATYIKWGGLWRPVFMVFMLPLAKLYSVSVIITLNSRKCLREGRDPYRFTTRIISGRGAIVTTDSIEFSNGEKHELQTFSVSDTGNQTRSLEQKSEHSETSYTPVIDEVEPQRLGPHAV
ncbi:hypothetical protein BKA62DRAFT_755667 [Auriculariales sp. MPI-PUGE-AT-0066]|nr:hypothetical protein BKA62DRAFT_755667 [Auriculariales sp. MPI-PUGE-AT-0066]